MVHRLDSGASSVVLPLLAEVCGPRVAVVQDSDIVELKDPVTVTYVGVRTSGSVPMLHVGSVGLRDVASAYRLGMKDLVHEVESPRLPDEIDRSLPVLTSEFVASHIEFAVSVPQEMRVTVCQDIIDYSHAFSWNTFDLGCISDVPNSVIRVDDSPAVQPFRRHLYTACNEGILHAKCDPYIELGIFSPASSRCKDRAQLTIVRTAVDVMGQDRNDPRYC